MKTRIHQDVIIAILIALIVAFLAWYGCTLPRDSRVFPMIILGLIAVLDVLVLASGIQKSRQRRTGQSSDENSIQLRSIAGPMLVFLLIVAYITLIRYLGYMIATPIFMLGLLLIFSVRSVKTIALTIAGYMIFAYLLFVWQLNIPLI